MHCSWWLGLVCETSDSCSSLIDSENQIVTFWVKVKVKVSLKLEKVIGYEIEEYPAILVIFG